VEESCISSKALTASWRHSSNSTADI